MKKTLFFLVFFAVLLTINISLAAEIRFAWDASNDPNVVGYKVYYGTSSGVYGSPIDVGKKTSYTITGLTAGQKYYLALKAYDASNKESPFSNEVVGVASDPNLNPTPVVLSPPTVSKAAKEAAAPKAPKGEVAADSDSYIIGAEDVLYIHVWREEPLSRSIPVRMDGKISMPLIDEVDAAGLTPKQLKEKIAEKLKEFIENPVVSVTVMEANSFKVFLSGQVRTPGVYRLRSETTILQIIPMAGGLTEWADQKKIMVIRKESGKDKRIIVNYRKLVKDGDLSQNIVLKSGDTIIVP
jgi:polysaccharide export outer membrane protein